MKTDFMRNVDMVVGRPLCRVLGFVKKNFRRTEVELDLPVLPFSVNTAGTWIPTGRGVESKRDKTVVVCKFFGLGSLILSTPVIRAVKNGSPHRRIILLTFAANRVLGGLLEGVDEVLTIRTTGPIDFLVDTFRAVRRIRRQKPEFFIDLEFLSKFTALLAYLSGADVRVGFWSISEKRGNLHELRILYNRHIHIVENFLCFVRACGFRVEEDWVGTMRKSLRWPEQPVPIPLPTGRPVALLSPSAADTMKDLKVWPRERWEQVARSLTGKGFFVVIDGTSRDTEFAGIQGDGILNLVGKTSLVDLMGLIQRSRLVICLDSAALHLAVSAERKTVALFGPESPTHYGYRHLPEVRMLYTGIQCSPCMNVYNGKVSDIACRNNVCMKSIEVNDVLHAVDELSAL